MIPGTKREQILEVAEEVFAEKGFNGATMREIAQGVDIKTPGLYYHFRNKEDIYNSLILEIYRQLGDRVLEPIREAPGVREKIRLLVDLLVDFWAEHRRFTSIIAQEVISGSDLIYSELVPNFLAPMFSELVNALGSDDLERYGFRDVDMPLLVFNVFGLTIFYFFSGDIFTTLTGEDSFSPEKIAGLKEEIVYMVFHGIEKDAG